MTGNGSLQDGRTLAQIESDLLKAEAAYADAAARLKEAERDCDAALDTINARQMEFDERVAELRQRSTPGSKWKPGMSELEEALLVQDDDISENANAISSTPDSGARKLDQVKPLKPSMDDGPFVKIKMQ